jgi:hypothetical protein
MVAIAMLLRDLGPYGRIFMTMCVSRDFPVIFDGKPNVVVEWFLFGRSRVQISALRPTDLTQFFVVFLRPSRKMPV